MKKIQLVISVSDEKETELSSKIAEIVKKYDGEIKDHFIQDFKGKVSGSGATARDVL